MPYVKNPYDDDREVVLRSEGGEVVLAKADDWVEVPEAEAKSLEEQGWELRKTDPAKSTKGGGS